MGPAFRRMPRSSRVSHWYMNTNMCAVGTRTCWHIVDGSKRCTYVNSGLLRAPLGDSSGWRDDGNAGRRSELCGLSLCLPPPRKFTLSPSSRSTGLLSLSHSLPVVSTRRRCTPGYWRTGGPAPTPSLDESLRMIERVE